MNNMEERLEGYPVGKIRSMVGKREDCYLEKFKKLQKGHSFNWAAFFFGPIWFAYRLMWLYGVIMLAVGLMILFIGETCSFLFVFLRGEQPVLSIFLTMLAQMVVMGCMADRLYWKYIKKSLDQAKRAEDEKEIYDIEESLKGVSVMSLVIMWIIQSLCNDFVMSAAIQFAQTLYYYRM